MKSALFSIALLSVAMSAMASEPMLGSGSTTGNVTAALGDAVAATAGKTDAWHLTAGRVQGKITVVDGIDEVMVDDAEGEGEAISVVRLYPNPTHQYLNIERTCDAPATVTLSTLGGATVMRLPISLTTESIDLGELPLGVYIIIIADDSNPSLQPYTAKIIKN